MSSISSKFNKLSPVSLYAEVGLDEIEKAKVLKDNLYVAIQSCKLVMLCGSCDIFNLLCVEHVEYVVNVIMF